MISIIGIGDFHRLASQLQIVSLGKLFLWNRERIRGNFTFIGGEPVIEAQDVAVV